MRLPRLLPFLCTAFALGCSSDQPSGDSQFSLLLTDAASDELAAFEVDVTAVVLRRSDGATVSALPGPVRVDFVELESLADLVAGGVVPAGPYAGVTLTLDFSAAVACLKGQTSNATVVDANGTPLTGTLDVPITFASGSRPNIIARRNHLWTLDLDLDQSVAIDAAGNRVLFTPVLRATVDPDEQKPVRLQGALGTADVPGRTFLVHKLASGGALLAPYTVRTTGSTLFQIDGSTTVGDTGLAALAARTSQGPRVFVQGTVDRTARVLLAAAVETGAGVPGNGQDWVLGHIVARTGGAGADATLTVLGQSVDSASGTRLFNASHTVQVARGGTRVLRRGFAAPHGTDDLNVGQRVMVFGELSGTAMDATAAHEGIARMLLTSVFGIAAGSASGNTLTLDVARFDLRATTAFDFTVGGVQEANPTAYTVDVTGLSTTGIGQNARIRAIGFVNPVGVPADANFKALALVDRTAAANLLLCQWEPANAVALTTANGVVSLAVTQAAVKVVYDGITTTLLQNTPVPSLAAAGTRGVYTIVEDGAAEVHLLFSSFASALQARTSAGSRALRVAAIGTFAAASQQLQASLASVVLQ